MKAKERGVSDLKFHVLTSATWGDLEKLFGQRGACGGCWCMSWRLARSDFLKQKGEMNRKALKALVDSGEVPGILAYAEGQPIGWCAVAPRGSFPRLERSRVLKPVDNKPVWSVVCFFVAKPFRGKGVSVRLLEAVVNYVREQGGLIVEGYPIEPTKNWRSPDSFLYTGLPSAFRKAGFVEVARRSKTRPIMRCML